MPIESNIKVVNLSGATVLQVDENGVRDGSTTPRVFSPFMELTTRIFATPLAAYMWRCIEGVWQVASVVADCSVTGGSGATADVLVCDSAEAPGSGVTQLDAIMDVEATAPFAVNGVLIAAPTKIFPGMLLARIYAGTVASIEGVLTVQLKRVQ